MKELQVLSLTFVEVLIAFTCSGIRLVGGIPQTVLVTIMSDVRHDWCGYKLVAFPKICLPFFVVNFVNFAEVIQPWHSISEKGLFINNVMSRHIILSCILHHGVQENYRLAFPRLCLYKEVSLDYI